MPLPTPDRSDLRCWDNQFLIEEAKYNPTPELAVVLAERLEKEQARADQLEDDRAVSS